jgi:predicted RNA-binding Zn-ribbon protein involved in translation (DUF1610 family)
VETLVDEAVEAGMTTHRDDDCIVFECDTCGDEYEADGDEGFMEAWDNAKSSGWRAYQEGGEWMHKCPECMTRRMRR